MTALLSEKESRVAGRGYQFRFLLLLSVVFAVGALLLFASLFLFLSRPIPGDYSSVFFALRHLTEFTLPMVSFSALVYILLVCGATAVLCIDTLHKIAGPLYRMGRVLDGFLSGDPVKPVVFREGDQASLLATAFNGFLGSLREDRRKWLEVMERAERLGLQDAAASGAEMEKAVAELEASLARYRQQAPSP